MKRSKMKSRFDTALSHGLLLVLCAWMMTYRYSLRFPLYFLSLLFYCLLSNDDSWPFAVILLSLFLFPYPSSDPDMREGTVIEVKARYVIVQNGFHKILLYTAEPVLPDCRIRFHGTAEELEPSCGFYRFDFRDYCKRQGITHSITPDRIEIVKPSRSLRGFLMKLIQDKEPDEQEVLRTVLFRFSGEEVFEGLFQDRSFSLGGVIVLIDRLLKKRCFPDTRKKIRFVLCILLSLLFRFPYLPVQRMIYDLLERCGLNGQKRRTAGLLIGLRLFPHTAVLASFLIPAAYTLMQGGGSERNISKRLFVGMCLESVLFHRINPLEVLLYPFLLSLSGFLWLLAFVGVWVSLPVVSLIRFIDRILSFFGWFSLPGTMIGLGLPFFMLLCASVKEWKFGQETAVILLLVFQWFGLFHPFAELTFLNVGQGDAILLRGPVSTASILIDTGKPTQERNLSSFLTAKGIRKLDALIVTHADNDHSGNQQFIEDHYAPNQVITEHTEQTICGPLQLYDLNDVRTEDENASSIVNFVTLNGMKILLTGDIDQKTERRIVQRYPNLHADLLKLSHHGSSTGSSELFLDCVAPKLAIISSGAYRIYHHPSIDVLERLNLSHIPYLCTREEGDISIFCLPGFNVLLTSRGKIAIIRV